MLAISVVTLVELRDGYIYGGWGTPACSRGGPHDLPAVPPDMATLNERARHPRRAAAADHHARQRHLDRRHCERPWLDPGVMRRALRLDPRRRPRAAPDTAALLRAPYARAVKALRRKPKPVELLTLPGAERRLAESLGGEGNPVVVPAPMAAMHGWDEARAGEASRLIFNMGEAARAP